MMEGPAQKRPKLLKEVDISGEDWFTWYQNLDTLQTKLLTGCLCHIETIELQRPPTDPEYYVESEFWKDYALQFISTINLLSSFALGQQFNGFMCPKILEMASKVSMDRGIWEMLLEFLDSEDKFITLATSKCFVSLFMWTKLPNLNEIFDELFKSVMITTNNPLKLSLILEIIRGVIEYKEEDEHPLAMGMIEEDETPNQDPNPSEMSSNHPYPVESIQPKMPEYGPPIVQCVKVELDSDVESEVKNMCVKALENWWTRLLSKFKGMMSNYENENEAPNLTFLSLWLSIISVKSNLSVIETKHFYMQLESFVPLLNSGLPPVLWKKLLDVFNEILCYGSTLSLQDVPNDETCDLAHLIIRCVKNRQFLQGVPYSRSFYGFGGSEIGPVDWEWESQLTISTTQVSTTTTSTVTIAIGKSFVNVPMSANIKYSSDPSSTLNTRPAVPSSSKSCSPQGHLSFTSLSPSSSSMSFCHRYLSKSPYPSSSSHPSSTSHVSNPTAGSSSSSRTSFMSAEMTNNKLNLYKKPISATSGNAKKPIVTATVYVGPTPNISKIDESTDESTGDRPLIQKVVLLILKCVAVTVKETRVDSDSSDNSSSDGSSSSASESDTNDMIIIEKSMREVFKHLDTFIKTLQPFHPATPLGEWIVKLFSDQDDALVESMLCVLDTFTGFMGRIQTPPDFYRTLNPTMTFVAFTNTVSADRDILLDFLMSNETCFLLYLLRFLKFAFKNWSDFVSSCGRDYDKTMGLLIRLRIALGRLVEKALFPYNINPVLRLLEKCEELYETNGGSNS